MSVIYVLLPVALLFAAAAVATYVWATRTGQFDDLETPPLRILHDDEDVRASDAPSDPKRGGGRPGTTDRPS